MEDLTQTESTESLSSPHQSHDKGYKLLLSNKKNFLSLLKSFIHEDWVNTIKETDLIRVEKSYISQDFSKREADIVYQMCTESNDIIFYCLLELQSDVDYQMPFRLLIYMTEIWRDNFKNTDPTERERKGYRLPAVIPIVLYNGPNTWTAPIQFKEMIAQWEQFGSHLVNFNYLLVDINHYDEQELYAMSTLLSSVFVIDRTAKHTADLVERLHRLLRCLQQLTPDEFRQFTIWLTHVILPTISSPLQPEIQDILYSAKAEEVATMISNVEIVMQKDRHLAFLEGEIKGEIKGRQEGEIKGEIKGERKAKLEFARKLLIRGHSMADIIDLTGLPADELEQLAKTLQ